jgi:subtilisin family serine protease
MAKWLPIAAVIVLLATVLGSPVRAACVPPNAGLDDFASGLPPEIVDLLAPGGSPAGTGFCAAPPPGSRAGGEPPAPSLLPPQAISGPFQPGEILIVVPGGPQAVTALAAELNLTILEQYASTLLNAAIARLGIPDGRPVAAVLAQIGADARISTTAPNHLLTLQGETAGESLLPAQLELGNLRAGVTGKNIKVAVLDTAADGSQPALRGAIEAEFDGMPDTPVKDRTHGTAIAGLIAGRAPMAGAAPEARLLMARVFDKTSELNPQTHAYMILRGLDWAVANGATIVNMSFAGPKNGLISQAVGNASRQGVTLIAAAGNSGPGAPFAYPAADEGVIAVTATDEDDLIYNQANRGRYVLVAAPGVDLLAPAPNGRADLVTGTSFAAALVSGLAALSRQTDPAQDPHVFARRLADTSIDLGPPGRDEIFGAGRVRGAQLIGR